MTMSDFPLITLMLQNYDFYIKQNIMSSYVTIPHK